jgi:hypothetical protein
LPKLEVLCYNEITQINKQLAFFFFFFVAQDRNVLYSENWSLTEMAEQTEEILSENDERSWRIRSEWIDDGGGDDGDEWDSSVSDSVPLLF